MTSRRLQVGRALDARERGAVDAAGDRAREHRLGRPGHVLQQDMAAADQRGEDELDLVRLAADDRFHVLQQARSQLRRAPEALVPGTCAHAYPLCFLDETLPRPTCQCYGARGRRSGAVVALGGREPHLRAAGLDALHLDPRQPHLGLAPRGLHRDPGQEDDHPRLEHGRAARDGRRRGVRLGAAGPGRLRGRLRNGARLLLAGRVAAQLPSRSRTAGSSAASTAATTRAGSSSRCARSPAAGASRCACRRPGSCSRSARSRAARAGSVARRAATRASAD